MTNRVGISSSSGTIHSTRPERRSAAPQLHQRPIRTVDRVGLRQRHLRDALARRADGAGVGHARISQSDDLLVVGAYAEGRDWDIIRATDAGAIGPARQRIGQVPLPEADPVDGADGPLMKLWRG